MEATGAVIRKIRPLCIRENFTQSTQNTEETKICCKCTDDFANSIQLCVLNLYVLYIILKKAI